MLFWSVVRHARHLSTTVLTPNIKLVGLKNTLSWVLWGILLGYWGRGMQHQARPKKKTRGTPHSAYGSLSLPAGGLNEGRSFLNEFRYIPHQVLFCAQQFPPHSRSSHSCSKSTPPRNHRRPALWVPGSPWAICRTPWTSIFLSANQSISSFDLSKLIVWFMQRGGWPLLPISESLHCTMCSRVSQPNIFF